MPEKANLCSLIAALQYEVSVLWKGDHALKNDVCDAVDSRISHIVQQIICAPYCNNFSLKIDTPSEVDIFDRAALNQVEMSDDVAPC